MIIFLKKNFVWLKGKQLEVPVDSFSFKNKIRMRNNDKINYFGYMLVFNNKTQFYKLYKI